MLHKKIVNIDLLATHERSWTVDVMNSFHDHSIAHEPTKPGSLNLMNHLHEAT